MPADFNIDPHVKTWRGFCKLLAGCVAGAVAVLALMAVFLT